MKYLTQHMKFAANPFFKGKVLTVTGIREWVDYETKQKLGWIVDVVITVDDTLYKHKDGEIGSNLFEKIALKTIAQPSVAIGDSVMPVNPSCQVWGDYKTNLSVKCDSVCVVTPTTGKDKA